jgi:hypothetical protein
MIRLIQFGLLCRSESVRLSRSPPRLYNCIGDRLIRTGDVASIHVDYLIVVRANLNLLNALYT